MLPGDPTLFPILCWPPVSLNGNRYTVTVEDKHTTKILPQWLLNKKNNHACEATRDTIKEEEYKPPSCVVSSDQDQDQGGGPRYQTSLDNLIAGYSFVFTQYVFQNRSYLFFFRNSL